MSLLLLYQYAYNISTVSKPDFWANVMFYILQSFFESKIIFSTLLLQFFLQNHRASQLFLEALLYTHPTHTPPHTQLLSQLDTEV